MPRQWRIMSYLLSLYRDVNATLQALSRNENNELKKGLQRIIGKLKAINTLGHTLSWFFFLHLPINLLIAEEKSLASPKKLRALLLDLRTALEKMIISRGRFRLIRQKDVYVDLRNPLISLSVPNNFKEFIPGFEFIPGTRPVLFSASHAAPPHSDRYTKDIARIVARKTRSFALISTVSRIYIDPNRLIGRISAYRRFMEILIKTHKIRLLVDLHAMHRRNENLVEIGTWYGISITNKLLDKLIFLLEKNNISYSINTQFVGGDIIFYHSKRPFVNAIQIEIANDLSKKEMRSIIKTLAEFASEIGGEK